MSVLFNTWQTKDCVRALAVSPDGAHVGTGVGRDVMIWNTDTGQAPLGPLRGHSDSVMSIAFSSDSCTLASASYDCAIRIWNTSTGSAVFKPLTGHTLCARSVTFSRNGHLLISGSRDKTIRFWDTLTGQPVGKTINAGSPVWSVALSADSTNIFAALDDGTIRSYDVGTGTMLLKFEGHGRGVYSVAASPYGHFIASGSIDNTVRIWDGTTGCAIGSPLKGHADAIRSVAFSPDGKYIASGSYDTTIRIWEVETGAIQNHPLSDHTGLVFAAIFTPNGTHLISASSDKTIKVWDISSWCAKPHSHGVMTELQVTLTPVEDKITSMTTLEQVIERLNARGCPNLTNQLDTTTISEYPISSGGFGDVYRCSFKNGTDVAIKTMRIHPVSSSQRQKHLKHAARELYAWAQCRHTNVHKLLGLVMFRNQIGMVAKWQTNGSLPGYLEQHTEVDRCIMCTQIAEGLSYLHQCKVIHGDLKGANVLVSERGVPQLADFGNAVLGEYTLNFTTTSTKDAHSTRWAAPELFESAPCSVPSDVYALGMTILETITGDVPWMGKSDCAIMVALVVHKAFPERPEGYIPINSKHGDTLWLLLKCCWEYEPEKRPSAAEVKAAMGGITQEGLKH